MRYGHKSMTNYVVIHHSKDLDGYTSAVIIIEFLCNKLNVAKDNIKTFPVDYNNYDFANIIESINQDTIVYIADFCFEKNEMNEIVNKAKLTYIIDHHSKTKTILSSIDNSKMIIVYNPENVKYSACGLAYEFFFKKSIEDNYIIECINNMDIWNFSKSYCTSVVSFVNSLPWKNYNVLRNLVFHSKINDYYIPRELIELLGETFSNSYEKQIELIISSDSGVIVEFEGYKCFLINNNNGAINSEMLNKSIRKYNVDIAMSYRDVLGDKPRRFFSLRSIDVDVNYIALKYGGGGHHSAAGFCLSLEDGIKLVNELVFNRRLL